jgi:hypothetical protein
MLGSAGININPAFFEKKEMPEGWIQPDLAVKSARHLDLG